MIEVTRFKLYPNREVEDKLFSNLRICSFVYNWCLEHNIWKDSVLPQLKDAYPDIKEVHSIVLQNVIHQVRDNVKVLSALKKKGKKVGRLRHKFRHSMIFEQTGFKIDGSSGLVIDHPKNVKKAEKKLRRQQMKLSRKARGSHNRKKQRRIVAKVHETIDNRRNDFLHKISRYYVDNYDLIALEDLRISELVQKSNTGMAKAMLDASWGKFANYVLYKAENAGKCAVQVIAKGTTQDCSVCGKTVPKDLSKRIYSCPYCGSVMPRDYNAAQNIKLRGIEMVGWGTPEPSLLNIEKLNTLAEIRTSILDINNPEQVFVNETRIFRL